MDFVEDYRIMERLNKDFRRRAKLMKIVAGNIACYRILATIALRIKNFKVAVSGY